MASFFKSFRSSLMAKQLLRFALSRLDLLDAQALDLENLDFALGRNTTLEFRDVGLVLQKLEQLLELPASFSLRKAKVLVLRVTIPVDFYASPITVEVDGVDIQVKIAPKEEREPQLVRKRRKGKGADDIVPTAADLAQSFLETQPVADKKELEEALAAETEDLGASVALSEAESDDDSVVGTGEALSLPAFLTGFLNGVVDRMQIRIRGVNFQVHLEVPVDPNAATPELVTFRLSLDSMDVEGVTAPGARPDGEPAFVRKPGKRHVLLDNIRAFLITEANVFSSLATSPSMPSSVASRSPVVSEAPPFPPLQASLRSSVSSGSTTSSGRHSEGGYGPIGDSEAALNIPYDFDDTGSEGNQFPAGEPASSHSTPRASIYRETSPPILREHANSAMVGPSDLGRWASFEREAQSAPHLRPPLDTMAGQSVSPADSMYSEAASSSSGGGEAEDLMQSHLYTHEEAESMYMSAFSQPASSRMRRSMPGSWDYSNEAGNDEEPQTPTLPPDTVSSTATLEPLAIPGPRSDDPESPVGSTSDQSQLLDRSIVQERARTPEKLLPTSPQTSGSPTEGETGHAGGEPPQEDVPTPRGPARLVKEIMSLSSVSVYVPSIHEHIHVSTPPDLDASRPDIPGAFSIYVAESSTRSPSSPPRVPHEPHRVDRSVEVNLSPLEIRFDASIAFLLAMVVGRLLEAVQSQPSSDGVEVVGSKPPSKTPQIKLAVRELSVLFLEKLAGVADTPERLLQKNTVDIGSDVLLQTKMANIVGSLSSSEKQTEATIGIEKFRFGYANGDILSFDRSVQMFESVASAFPSAGQDISVKLTTNADSSRIDVNTLPLHVMLDLQHLDETFSWFGGLSSFLNMGSSITSNASKGHKVPAIPPRQAKGVRFDDPINPDNQAMAKTNKADLRINGLRVDVVGRECSVALNTSALKLVSREGGIGVHFSKIQLTGPHMRSSRAEAPIFAELTATRIEYRMVPRDADLEMLLELITPSKVKFDANGDEIMVDTLLRQRRKGAVLSLTVGKVKIEAGQLSHLACLPSLAEDLAKLGTVAKYLPEDDRPGLLTLLQVNDMTCRVDVGGRFGSIEVTLQGMELAHISLPALVAVAINGIAAKRNQIEDLVDTLPAPQDSAAKNQPGHKRPVLMMRLIDDMEPVLKVLMNGLNVEYRVPTIMDILNLADDATPQDFEASLAASVANLGDHAHAAIKRTSTQTSSAPAEQPKSKPIKVDVVFKDCLIGLNPLGLPSKLALVLTDAHVEVTPGQRDAIGSSIALNKASVILIDDVSLLDAGGAPFASTRKSQQAPSPQVKELCAKGFVHICQITATKAWVRAVKDDSGETRIEADMRDTLLVVETCADSTQTLIALANALKPPTPPSKENKYRTTVMPVEDLLSSITADAFGSAEGNYNFDDDFALAQSIGGDMAGSEEDFYGGNDSPLQLESQYYVEDDVQEELFNAASESVFGSKAPSDVPRIEETSDGILLSTASFGDRSSSGELSVAEGHFGSSSITRKAYRWNSKKSAYERPDDAKLGQSPFRMCVRSVHVIWHLFDGYDWARTREVISKAVQDVEAKAHERRAKADRRGSHAHDADQDEEETVIGDFLFNSIYIGIPSNRDPRELAQAINRDLRDDATETESIATTAFTTSTTRPGGQSHSRAKSLKLNRSRRHKITFELQGVNIDMVTFPPGSGETINSIDVRVQDLVVFDHVPTSTWKKFAMYDLDAGERELGAHMIHLLLLNTKPLVDMPASEIVLKVSVLPLRLHVDQDALDFITRFFGFKDESVPLHASPSDVPFIQRAEISDVPVRLDFKPKRVDYAGLRSGHTTEFMNFMILDDARMVLKHVILYGVQGFDRLGEQLNDIWTDNVKRTQLPGVLAGLAPVRSLVSAGSGFRELIEIPIREYRKDGRIVRSIGKGATAFAKTTGTEVVKLGAKLAIGTQNALQGAEGLFVKNPHGEGSSGSAAAQGYGAGDEWDVDSETGGGEYEREETRQISLYAHQPLGIIQGMRGAYASLAQDLSLARDAIIAVPAEVMESQSAQGAAKAVLKRAPTIIFRPAIGATKAIGQTLLGATNSLDPMNRKRVEAKYKKH